jgi:hypothetical protein
MFSASQSEEDVSSALTMRLPCHDSLPMATVQVRFNGKTKKGILSRRHPEAVEEELEKQRAWHHGIHSS